jgi:hypothetical protein
MPADLIPGIFADCRVVTREPASQLESQPRS